MKQTEAEVIKEDPVMVNPKVIKGTIYVIKCLLQFGAFILLLIPWCSGWKLLTAALILAWFSQQLNNLKK